MIKKIIISCLTILSFGVSMYFYASNISIDEAKYGSSTAILIVIPLTMVMININFFTLPRLRKLQGVYSRYTNGFDSIFLSLNSILFILHCGVLLVSAGNDFDLLKLIPISMGIVLITTANTLPRFQLELNENSSQLMNSTNQLWNTVIRPFSYPLFIGGLIMLCCGFLSGIFMLISFFTVFVGTLLLATFKSYRAYQIYLSQQ
ncbi:hypothetical protein [Bacillus sp. T33-2]|uniref:hypothetical protein n=1 Tax=Bacillus sp. T33-2 TaxID=2054168 RepID=UPI000C75EC4B|nr:hypothetical protein [Bacillus sp. T33-2]PLR89818.1 hypothetical protein CVD19_23340 [Bacillus sp. T33-2]